MVGKHDKYAYGVFITYFPCTLASAKNLVSAVTGPRPYVRENAGRQIALTVVLRQHRLAQPCLTPHFLDTGMKFHYIHAYSNAFLGS